MPETAETETPPRRVMRQWYQAKLGERLLQAGQMAQSRELLRRGSLKMQDGTLGQPGDPAGMDEPMQIRVGDEVHYHTESAVGTTAPATPATATSAPSLFAKAAPLLLAGVLGASGVGIPWLIAAMAAEPAVDAAAAVVDTDTQYILDLVPTE